jgi:hypothetical protein
MEHIRILYEEALEAHRAILVAEKVAGISEDVLSDRLSELLHDHTWRSLALDLAFGEYERAINRSAPSAWPELDREHRQRIEAMTGRSYPDPAEA